MYCRNACAPQAPGAQALHTAAHALAMEPPWRKRSRAPGSSGEPDSKGGKRKGAPGSSGAPDRKGGKGTSQAEGGWSPGEGGWRHNPHAKENLLKFHCDMTPQRLDDALREGRLTNFTEYLTTERDKGCFMQLREKAEELGLVLSLRFQRPGPGGMLMGCSLTILSLLVDEPKLVCSRFVQTERLTSDVCRVDTIERKCVVLKASGDSFII